MLWSWESDDRAAFIKVVTRFSSNYAQAVRATPDSARQRHPCERAIPARVGL